MHYVQSYKDTAFRKKKRVARCPPVCYFSISTTSYCGRPELPRHDTCSTRAPKDKLPRWP